MEKLCFGLLFVSLFCISNVSARHKNSGVMKEDYVDPWTVKAVSRTGLDYNKLVKKFGSEKIDLELIKRFEKVIGKKAHVFLRRGIVFSHRDMHSILDLYEARKKFYLYTGRGPSADSMHIGHMIPFMFTKWLQDTFNVPLVIQLSDDEKALWKSKTIDEVKRFDQRNVRDIIAVGFRVNRTFIFNDLDFIGQNPAFYQNMIRIEKLLTLGQMRKAFHFTDEDVIGKITFPSIEAAPAFSTSFPFIFGDEVVPSLVVCAIDQDPLLQVARDVADSMHLPAPALIHTGFLPALTGAQMKASASAPDSTILLGDTPEQIEKKILKYAYYGDYKCNEKGHRTKSGNTDVNIAYQYLKFFLEDDDRLAQIKKLYESGEMLPAELKRIAIDTIVPIMKKQNERRNDLTDDIVMEYFRLRNIYV